MYMLCMLMLVVFAAICRTGQVLIISKGKFANPFDMCRAQNIEPLMVTDSNRPVVIEVMKRIKIDAVAIGGWNGVKADLVLRDSGNIAPYEPLTNNANYVVFCGVLSDANEIACCNVLGLKRTVKSAGVSVSGSVGYAKPQVKIISGNVNQSSAYHGQTVSQPRHAEYASHSMYARPYPKSSAFHMHAPVDCPIENVPDCFIDGYPPNCTPNYPPITPCYPPNYPWCQPNPCPSGYLPDQNIPPNYPWCMPNCQPNPCPPGYLPDQNTPPNYPWCMPNPCPPNPCPPITCQPNPCPPGYLPDQNTPPNYPWCPPSPCPPIPCPPITCQPNPCPPGYIPDQNTPPNYPWCPPSPCPPIPCPPNPCPPITCQPNPCPPGYIPDQNTPPNYPWCLPNCQLNPCPPGYIPDQNIPPNYPWCPPNPCPPIPCYPFPSPCYPCPPTEFPDFPCPWERRHRHRPMCRPFPKHDKSVRRRPELSRGDSVPLDQICTTLSKTYVVYEDSVTQNKYTLKETTNAEEERTRIMRVSVSKPTGCEIDNLAYILRFPAILIDLRNYIATTMKQKRVCIYVGRNGILYAMINGVLNQVAITKNTTGQTPAITYTFTPVDARAIHNLAQSGLNAIMFRRGATECH